MTFTHASVFSGIGGPEVAAAMLGWENLFHCEINPFGRKVLQYWFPNSISYEDIKKTDFTEWRGRIDVLTGGFPCQPFSVAGKRKGYEDDRYLWQEMHRCIKEIQPTWFVCENVAGILTMVEQGEVSQVASEAALFGEVDPILRFRHRATFTIERICRDIESDGYEVQPVLIPACAVGAPHQRNRIFIIGRLVEDSDNLGLQRNEVMGHKQRQRNTRTASQDGQVRPPIANASDPRSESQRQERQDEIHRLRPTPNAESERSREIRHTRQAQRTQGSNVLSGLRGGLCSEGGQRWRGFPTVSPVCRGNDGFPFDVDDLSIPANKWRNESIKAYGNAIVPQVMYEIFRAIEETEIKK